MKSLGSASRRARTGCFGLALLGSLLFAAAPAPALGADPARDPRKLFEELNNTRLDPAQVYVIRNGQITRDRVKFYFNQGFLGFFTPVAGEITGAVFTGEGEVLMVPPNDVEKRNLAQFTQAPILEEQFTTAILRFTDATARELLAFSRKPDPDDPEQPTGFTETWNPTLHSLNPDYTVRILQDLLGARNQPYFHARIQGADLRVFEVNVDERQREAVTVGAARRSGERVFADLWCVFPSRTSATRFGKQREDSVGIDSYRIETRIGEDHSLEGRAELRMESLSGTDRVLVFELSRWLKVTGVKDEQGQSLVVFQNRSEEESEAAARDDNWIVVVLPAPRPPGEKFRLSFAYQGNVIANVGNGVLYVGARGSWYPNRGLAPPASYDLSFEYPKGLTLVATGERVEEGTSGGITRSRWRSDGVFRVVGFNLGSYTSVQRAVGKASVEVYATREAEADLERKHAAAQPPGVIVTPPLSGEGSRVAVRVVPTPAPPLAPSALLDRVADRAARALQLFEKLFGPFPYSRLAISQIPGNFGQGWPELVYLPTLSFLTGSELTELGVVGKSDTLLNEGMVAHEIAHQWWGNQLGWAAYHDQWVSEGLASYSAALYLAQEKDGEKKFRDYLSGFRRDLLAKTRSGNTVESGGPIWLGQRLSNSLNPDGYTQIVYKKAPWVLHMLRVILRDPASGSDERFFRMLREFAAAHRGESVSTEDFVGHAEKYMTPVTDLEHNGRLDWFFDEWVYETGIPTYSLSASTRRLAANRFVVQGKIEQSGVSSGFEMLVPVVAVYGKEKKIPLGQVPVSETGGRFKFTVTSRPLHVAIDDDNILAVVH